MHLTGNPHETDLTRLTLNWQPPHALNGALLEYRIFYSSNSSAPDEKWKFVKADGSSLTKEISGLKPGTAYFFKMKARTKKGWGPMSSPKNFSTLSSKCSVCNCSVLEARRQSNTYVQNCQLLNAGYLLGLYCGIYSQVRSSKPPNIPLMNLFESRICW